MSKFWKLSEAEVAFLQEEARKATILRADIDRRCQAAVDVICGRSDAMTVEEALVAFEAAVAEEKAAPVPAYIAPVKRWAGGPPDIDAWYWDRP